MKTYKHKTLWWSAEIDWLRWRVKNDVDVYFEWLTFQSNYAIQIPTILIENSSDREEVVEKDWIDDARQKFRESAYREEPHLSKNVFRTVIEKHAPGTKKFTRDEIIAFYSEGLPKTHWQHIDWAVQFLSKHNLLSTDTD